MLTQDMLRGCVPAIVTPFTPAGEIMEDEFREMVRWLIDSGATGICVAGDNGESWTLDVLERKRLTEIAIETAAGRIPIILGVTAPSAVQTIRYARAAQEAGAAGVLVMPQTYVLKSTREELLRRFDALAKAVDLPIVVYNSPRRATIELSLDDLDALLGIAPIVGIKESNRDFFHLTNLIERFRHRLSIMVGPAYYVMPGLALGAHGFISSGPELFGSLQGRIGEIALEAANREQAQLHYRLSVVYQALMAAGTWPAALKAALNLIGQPAGVPRDPVLPLAGPALDKLKGVLDDAGLLRS